MNRTLIITCPTWQHESLSDVVAEALRQQTSGRIRMGGSPDLKLLKEFGNKCPDLVLCDPGSDKHAGFPTVAFEVGYTQSQAALNYNAARLLFGSGGKINAVVTTKVHAKGTVLEYLGVDIWRMIPAVVAEEDVVSIPTDTILLADNTVAIPTVLSWSFSCLSVEEGVMFRLKTKVHHYEVNE